jgi:HEAT repeat protein
MTTDLPTILAKLQGSDDELAHAAAMDIAALPTEMIPDALRGLEMLLADPNADKRWWAVRALAEIPDGKTPDLLVEALKDESPSVRQCAALGLRLQPNSAAIPPLAAALDDEDHLVREIAAEALAGIGEPAVLALLEVLENGSRISRLFSVRALAKIGDTRAIPALFTALDEDSALMEYWAAEGLERMGVGMAFFTPS